MESTSTNGRLDSWIEVSSRPSSSSLSSAAEEIITTGLRVQQEAMSARRRRRSSRMAELAADASVRTQDDSEHHDDSDQIMESSADELAPRQSVQQASVHSSASADASGETSSDDSDENATAIGVVSPNDPFVPRPNAFSLPSNATRPQEQHASHPGYAPPPRPYRASQRHSYPSQQQQHSPFTAISPSHQVDHDAALRASLSTLLSYANAARSLPKNERSVAATAQRPAGGNRIDVATLGLVSESVAFRAGDSSVSKNEHVGADEKVKQKEAISSKRESRSSSKDRDRSRSKKQRRIPVTAVATTESVSPTLLTWVVGAGMIVLVSAISFSAGYVVGREAGTGAGGFSDSIPGGTGAGDYAAESVAGVTSLSGNLPSTGGNMRRNLKSSVGLGMGWRSTGIGASA
jgi:hypothetical protein